MARAKKMAAASGAASDRIPPVEWVSIGSLRPHPRNYREHPEDQLAHLRRSIAEHGFYRNVVATMDGTILAGHGVVEAARSMGLGSVPVIRLDLDPESPAAMKVVVGDNEIAGRAEVDDRRLTEMLREIRDEAEGGLEGTGFDEAMLANLLFITRTESEIRSKDAAAEWAGMPDYDLGGDDSVKLVVSFPSAAERDRFVASYQIRVDTSAIKGTTWSTRWPWSDHLDKASVRFEARDPAGVAS